MSEEERAEAIARVDIERLPPRPVQPTDHRPRWNARNITPISPHQLIDGRIIRSALHLNRRRKRRLELRFPQEAVTSCLEPANPWKLRKDLKRDAVIAAYKEACTNHKVSPLQSIIYQLKSINNIEDRCEELKFKDVFLHPNDCEALEEVFRRVLFKKVDLNGTITDDESAEILFQIFEFYEATTHLDISNNRSIGSYGWQACSRMLRKTESLKRLDAVNVCLNEEFMITLTRGLRYAYLYTLRFEMCQMSGRLMELLVIALKFNMALRELYLRGNGIHGSDCRQIETLLKFNSRLIFLDLSDNIIQDDGLYYIINGLTHQLHFGKFVKSKKGLETLILYNNKLTRRSAKHINAAIKESKTLRHLNIGLNALTDDSIMEMRDSLIENRTLRTLDLQSTEITCFGISELGRVLKCNNVLDTIDLQNNPIYKLGVLSLIEALEVNKHITEINIDQKAKIKSQSPKIKTKYSELVKQLQSLCERNKEIVMAEEAASNESDSYGENESDDEKDESIFDDQDDDLKALEDPSADFIDRFKRISV